MGAIRTAVRGAATAVPATAPLLDAAMGVTPAHFATYPDPPGGKTCTICGDWKPLDAFSPQRQRSGTVTRHPHCKPCRSAYVAERQRVEREMERQHGYEPVRALRPDTFSAAVTRWNGMRHSARKQQREQCHNLGHRYRPTDFSPRVQMCLACCTYQEEESCAS